MNKFELVKLENDDLLSLVELFQIVWGGNYDKRLHKTHWAFNNNHSRVLVLKHENKIIAARGGFEWPLLQGTTQIKTYQFHGTCVHPDYRRMGLFSKLNLAFIEQAKNDGFELIFNVSVKSSMLGYKKLGWQYLKGFHRLTKIHSPIKFLLSKLGKNENHTNNFKIENDSLLIENVLENYNFKRFKVGENQIITDYSKEFLTWRLKNPGENYRVYNIDNSFVVYKIKYSNGLKEVILGDYFLVENSYILFKKLLNHVIEKENPDISYSYIFSNHPYYKHYLKALYMPNPLHYNLYFGTRPINNNYTLSNNWLMSFLDIDTF